MTIRLALFVILLQIGFLSGCGAAVRPLPAPIAASSTGMLKVLAPSSAANRLPDVGIQPDLPDELFERSEEVSSSCSAPVSEPAIEPTDLPTTLDPGERVLRIAQQFIGTPYRKGGASPAGFDCSGLVYYTYRQLGLTVPRTSATQHLAAQKVNLDSLRSGDLLFFKVKPQRVSHVGIFVEGDLFLHATSTGKSVTYSRLGEPYWKKRLVGAGRLVVD